MMKIVRFSQNGHTARLGCYVHQDEVMDLAASCVAFLTAHGVVRATAIADALFPQSTRGFLEGGVATQEMLAKMLEGLTAGTFEPVTAPAAEVRFHAPILRPQGETRLDWEVELGVVIGKTARSVSKEQALDDVYGYTIINDASARDFQCVTSQWAAGKMGDTLAPVGPSIADKTEIPDPHMLDLKTGVNGTLMQNGNTRNFIFDVRYLVSSLSQLLTLAPGDLIATGTPAGAGFSRQPPVVLQPGDTVRLEITGLGVLENSVKDA